MKKGCALLAALAFSTGAQAQIIDIVNTGPGGASFSAGTTSLSSSHWVAAEFSISEAYNITSVLGWLANGGPTAGTAHAVLYTDGGDVPGTELFSQSFSVSSFTPSFVGVGGVDWTLDAGTYWVAFEVRTGDTLLGGVPTPLLGGPTPTSALGNEAHWATGTGIYTGLDGLDMGIVIRGEAVTAIPEPETYLMLLIGLGLLGFQLHRRRRQQ